jgi:hypothetical protein
VALYRFQLDMYRGLRPRLSTKGCPVLISPIFGETRRDTGCGEEIDLRQERKGLGYGLSPAGFSFPSAAEHPALSGHAGLSAFSA